MPYQRKNRTVYFVSKTSIPEKWIYIYYLKSKRTIGTEHAKFWYIFLWIKITKQQFLTFSKECFQLQQVSYFDILKLFINSYKPI